MTKRVLEASDFPAKLRGLPIWAYWKLFHRVDIKTGQRDKKPSKMLVDRFKKSIVAKNNFAGLQPFQAVVTDGWNKRQVASGIRGVAVRFEAPHDLLFIDLDDVRNSETGRLHPVAAEFIRLFPTWAEISQSGKGLHLIYLRSGKNWNYGTRAEKRTRYEAYDGRRFVALTGNRLAGAPAECWPVDLEALAAFAGFTERQRQAVQLDALPAGLVPREELERVVSRIDPGCDRNTWISTLFGLKHLSGGSADGLEVAIEWSRGYYAELAPANYVEGVDDKAIEGLWVYGEARDGPAATAVTLYRRAELAVPKLARRALHPERGEAFAGLELDFAEDMGEDGSTAPPARQAPAAGRPAIEPELLAKAKAVITRLAPKTTVYAAGFRGDEASKLAVAERLIALPAKVVLAMPDRNEVVRMAAFLQEGGADAVAWANYSTTDFCARVRFAVAMSGAGTGGTGNAMCFGRHGERCCYFDDCRLVQGMWRRIPDADVVTLPGWALSAKVGRIEGQMWAAAAMGDKPIVLVMDGRDYLDNEFERDTVLGYHLEIARRLDVGPAWTMIMEAAFKVFADMARRPFFHAVRAELGLRPGEVLDEAEQELQAERLFNIRPDLPDEVIAERIKAKNLPTWFRRCARLVRALRGPAGCVNCNEASTEIQLVRQAKVDLAPGRFGDFRVMLHPSLDMALMKRMRSWLRQPVDFPPAELIGALTKDRPVVFQLVDRDTTMAALQRDTDARALCQLRHMLWHRYGETGITAARVVLERLDDGMLPVNGRTFGGESVGYSRGLPVTAHLVIGQNSRSPADCYRCAANFTGLPPLDTPNLDRRRIPCKKAIVGQDGLERTVEAVTTFWEAVNSERDLEAGVRQGAAIDHVRFEGPRQEGVVYVMSTFQANGYAPTELITYKQLFGFPQNPGRLVAVHSALGGVIPLSVEHLRRLAPAIFTDREHAKRFVEGIRKGPLSITHPAWVWQKVEVEVSRSRGRKGKTLEGATFALYEDPEAAARQLAAIRDGWMPEAGGWYGHAFGSESGDLYEDGYSKASFQ